MSTTTIQRPLPGRADSGKATGAAPERPSEAWDPPVSAGSTASPSGSDAPTGPSRRPLGAAFGSMFAGGVAGKALGFVRELVLAASFGTSPAVGAFRAGQTATLIPTHFFTSHTLNSGFIPLCARYVAEDRARANALFWSVFATMTGVAVAISAVLFFGADLWAGLLVPGFGHSARITTAAMIRVMALGVPLLIQASLFSYLEMAQGSFVVGSLRPTVQNVGLFAGIGAAVALEDPIFLAWGFNLFALLYHGSGVWRVTRGGFLSRPSGWRWGEARGVLGEFLTLIRPLLLLPVVLQGAIAVERIVASLISSDAVAAMDYAKTVSETGLVLIAVPLGFVGLAEFGRLTEPAARRRLHQLVPLLLISMVPASLFLGIHVESVVRVLFERGQFGQESVATTSAILRGLAVGFWANVAGYVLIKVMNARLQNRQTLHLTGIAAAVHIAANLALYSWLGPVALGIGASLFGLISFALAVRALNVTDLTSRTLAVLSVGAILYAPLGLALRGPGIAALAVSGALCALYWALFVAAVPELRQTVLEAVRLGDPPGAVA